MKMELRPENEKTMMENEKNPFENLETSGILQERLEDELIERTAKELLEFIKLAFREINPGRKFLENWHIYEICLHLSEVYHNRTRRLIINMPPRYLKSFCVSVCFVAWGMGKDPTKRFIASSYSLAISIKHSLDTKRIMQSEWYQKMFPETKIARGQNAKQKFCTDVGGFRLSTSTGGSLTGEGGDFLIVDDPHKPAKINSKTHRESTIDWFRNTFASRLNDNKKGGIIIVMQRLHTHDLTGMLLEGGKRRWKVLLFRLIAIEREKYRKVGELLHPERDGAEEVETLKDELGERVFMAQYQQMPMNEKGGIFREKFINLVEPETLKKGGYYVFSIDTASKVGIGNDYSVITIWYKTSVKNGALISCERVQMDFGDLFALVKDLILQYKPRFVIIEDKGSGIPLIQQLQKLKLTTIVPYSSTVNKAVRLISAIPYFERGDISFSNKLPNLDLILEELLMFPDHKNDDIVDSISQFVNWNAVFAGKVKQAPSFKALG